MYYTVYISSFANDRVTGNEVAIKKITRPFAHPITAKRTYREFMILNLANHINVMLFLIHSA